MPVWLGAGGVRLLQAAAPFMPSADLPQTLTPYFTGQPFEVGPFRLTPYLMDHSGYDAHALLVEADGRRVFYSGDFRGHGRKASAFERFLATFPSVDLLLLEGTSLGRSDAPHSEAELEREVYELIRPCRGPVFTSFSAQNIDRFVSLLRACMRAGRLFVIDAYLANILNAIAMDGLPDIRLHPGLRVYLPRSQRRVILRSGRFELIDAFRACRIYLEEILTSPEKFVVMTRASMIEDFASIRGEGGLFIYSQWPGYLDRDRIDWRGWACDRALAFHVVHSSGHAGLRDLQRLVEALQPRRVVPIHTDHPALFPALFPRVERCVNGTWVDV